MIRCSIKLLAASALHTNCFDQISYLLSSAFCSNVDSLIFMAALRWWGWIDRCLHSSLFDAFLLMITYLLVSMR